MPFTVAFGQQHLDGLAKKLVARIAEQDFGLAVDQHDAAVAVDRDNRIRSDLHEAAELGFRYRRLMEQPCCTGVSRIPNRSCYWFPGHKIAFELMQ
jgi:hypothetical protein